MSLTGLVGLNVTTTKAAPNRPLRGLHGISITINTSLSIRVVDSRGRGMYGVTCTNLNTGKVFNGDNSGNLLVAAGVTASLVITKDRLSPYYLNWSSSDAVSLTINLDNNLII